MSEKNYRAWLRGDPAPPGDLLLGAAVICPKCGEPGTVQVFWPTGHTVIVHPGEFLPDGVQMADTGCVLPRGSAR